LASASVLTHLFKVACSKFKISDSIPAPRRQQADRVILFPSPFSESTYALSSEQQAWHGSPRKISLKRFYKFALFVKDVTFVLYGIVNHAK
jgi:hypothetical protein